MSNAQSEFWEAGGRYRPAAHPVVEIFARQRIRHLAAHGLLRDVRRVLDVGAGSGFSSAFYPPGIQVVASDYASGMLAANPVRGRIRAEATALPFESGAFDLVTCWELLHHLDDPCRALAEMWRVARRRVVVFEPNRIHPGHLVLALTRPEERGTLRFSPGHLRRLMRAACGRLDRHERCGLFFPNVTPLPLAQLLDRLPYRMPLVGISQLAAAEKE